MNFTKLLSILLAGTLLLSGCAGAATTPDVTESRTESTRETGQPVSVPQEEMTTMDTNEHVIYLAGGCFWGIEYLMQSIPGVLDATSGYANGTGPRMLITAPSAPAPPASGKRCG